MWDKSVISVAKMCKKAVYMALIVLVLLPIPTAQALNERDKAVLFPFFSTRSSQAVCTAGAAVTGNTDYAGRAILSPAQLQAITQNQPYYEKAGQEVDIPWQLIAAIHVREFNLKRENPANGQGIYQFFGKEGGPYPAGPVSDTEFQRQTSFMATKLKTDYLNRNYPANRTMSQTGTSPEVIKDIFFSYNGRSSKYAAQGAQFGFNPNTQGYEGSPYVMNKTDANRDPAVNKTTWGQVRVDRGPIVYPANDDHGAFVIFSAIAGGSGGSCSSSGSGKVVEILERELVAGASEANSGYLKYGGGAGVPWCAYFLSYVLKEAGKPLEGGPIGAVSAVRAYAQTRNFWHPKGESGFTPQPGDIVVWEEGISPYPSHVNTVVAYESATDTITTIGGNESNAIKKAEWQANMPAITGYIRIP